MDDGSTDRAVSYGSYLRVDDLLSLQQLRSPRPEHDELLFIVIHATCAIPWDRTSFRISSRFARGCAKPQRGAGNGIAVSVSTPNRLKFV